MVYVHATTVCQMSCAHCCVDYGAGKRGKHMDFDTFIGAVNYAADYGDYVTIGGGEISLHPKFRQMVMHILDSTRLSLHMVTNGGKAINGVSKNIRWLIELIESGMYEDRVDAELSLDQFHDPVEDGQVLAYFTRYRRSGAGYTYQKVRDVGDRKLVRVGRAKNLPLNDYEWQSDPPEAQCGCTTMQVYPDGRITACGCTDSPVIGNIQHHGYNILQDLNDLPSDGDGCYSPTVMRLKAEHEAKEAV